MKIKIRGLVFVGFAAAVFAQSALADAESDKTVTSKTYVDTKFQDQSYRVTTTPAANSGDWTSTEKYPSMAVLNSALESAAGDFQRQLDTANEDKDPYIGIVSNGESDWKPLRAGSNEYVTVSQHTSGGVVTDVTIGIPSSEIASSSVDIAGAQGTGPADSSDLTTAKAVYDFVTGYAGDTYQPKTHVDSDNGQTNETLKVGTGEGQWSVIQAYDENATGNNDTGYITISHATSRGVYEINLDGNQIARHGVTDSTNTNEIVTGSNKLPTANAVYEYAVKQHWDSTTQANKTLVTDSNGVVTVSTVPTLPGFGDQDPCKVAGVHCALVTNYDTTNGISFEWTVMAQ